MLFNVDGLDESEMTASSICVGDLADVDTRREHVVPSETFWDCSSYSDFAQTWLENDAFSSDYDREKNLTLAITSQPFSDTTNSESPSTLFPCQEPFRVEPSVLKQSNFDDDPWREFISANLTTHVDDPCSPSLLAQRTGKENMPHQPHSPTLNDFPAFSDSSIWAGSLSAKFRTHSPQKTNSGVPDTFISSHSPAPMCLPQAPTRSQGQRKGLFGWGNLQTPNMISSVLRPRFLSSSPEVGAVLDPHILTLNADSPLGKRPRQSILSSGSSGINSESLSLDSDGSQDESDSDDYSPSCSPSPKFKRLKKKHSDPTLSPKPAFKTIKRSKISQSKKAKKKGSAALALAVVTHIDEVKREAQTLQVSLDPDFLDPVRVYHEGVYVAKKRRNQSIPVPIPVPNLNKKSRGRKVPFIANRDSPVSSKVGASSIEHNLGGQLHKPTRSRKKAKPVSPSDESRGIRSFVCVIPGCGKCFVRGEHLKRHVRSIHTNDKPHACPIEGCDKSFSRRDNLGQHVRVHLQP